MTSNPVADVKAPRSRWVAFAAALALAFGLSGVAVQPANAAVGDDIYDEGDSPNPIDGTNSLIFYKAADLGWWVNGVNATIPIADVGSMAYTVEDSTSFAPSFQLITFRDPANAYGRLVWEPYQQDPAQDQNEGTYTNLEDGVWWTNKIAGTGPGTQSDPQPLSFFHDGGGAGWTNVRVAAIDLHQGTTTESTSLVTNVTYDGTSIPLGNADNTPFDQADIDAAVAARVASHPYNQADLDAAVASYASTHHFVDGDYIGASRAYLKPSPVAGKKLYVVRSGTLRIATNVTYQWYLEGSPVPGATNSSYMIPANARGKVVSVRVIGTHMHVRFGVQSNTRVVN